MYSVTQPNTPPPAGTRSRSLGIKLLIVCGLVFAMAIPAFFVDGLIDERTKREGDVKSEISSHVGGAQAFLGPTLAVPYTIAPSTPAEVETHGVYLIFPQKGEADLATRTEERHRSLFRVPVFQADIQMTGVFDLTGVPTNAPERAQLAWNRAEIIVGVSDARGALADGSLTTDAGTSTLTPSSVMDTWPQAVGANNGQKLTVFGSRVQIVKANAKFTAVAKLRFSGAERIAVLPFAKTTHATARGDWKNPGFDGSFLPVSRTVDDRGFNAEWNVPFIARGIRAEGPANEMLALINTSMGTSFIEVVDPYQSVTRALKYVLLFLSLVFLTYFVFETTTGKRVHPAQYVLIGVAQIIFYLLLLSFAERIGFDFAFLLGGGATVALLSVNAGWIFGSRLQAMRAAVVFSLLYTFIFLLLKLEDNALLIGAMASFAVVAAVMYFTRNLDWYNSLSSGGGKHLSPPFTPAPAASVAAASMTRYESLLEPL